MTNVFWSPGGVTTADLAEWLPVLDRAARTSPLRRSRLCLHAGPEALIHDMLIVLCGDSRLWPQNLVGASKSFHMVSGAMTVVLFRDDGAIESCLDLAAPGQGQPFLFRLDRDIWHTVVPRCDQVVYHEVTAGPFTPDVIRRPPWLPGDEAGQNAFHDGMVRHCASGRARP